MHYTNPLGVAGSSVIYGDHIYNIHVSRQYSNTLLSHQIIIYGSVQRAGQGASDRQDLSSNLSFVYTEHSLYDDKISAGPR